MIDLYTNRISHQDFVKYGFHHHTEKDMDIFIATAFFTEIDAIEQILEKNCHLRIIVRLGFPTSPYALEKLLTKKKVEVRFFTSSSFHPKLYIFGDSHILIGSANLTTSALLSNQEIMVSLNASDPRFEELRSLFSCYWEEAKVLDKESISEYKKIYNKHNKIISQIKSIDDEVIDKIGDINYSNINRGKRNSTEKSIYLESYRKSYQTALYAYQCIEDIYRNFNRKFPDNIIPMRLEIDSFFSFVRDIHAVKETWEMQPLGWTEKSKIQLGNLIQEWLSISWEHFEEQIVPVNYPLINKIFNSPESIKKSTIDEIVEGLCVLHSFHDRLRFYKGGLDTLKKEFIEKNDVFRIKNTLSYLLFGKGEIIERMANCIYEEEYKLNEFGQSNVQELIGWINKENLPVVNGRTTKVLRYFGFDVRQL